MNTSGVLTYMISLSFKLISYQLVVFTLLRHFLLRRITEMANMRHVIDVKQGDKIGYERNGP